ncbi:MAG: phosphoribosyl-AMP cyclohydrolase [Pseudomonadota bacterium]
MTTFDPPLNTASEQDETNELRPKFNADGLVAAIAQDADTGEVLMLAWMNADALEATIRTKRGTYWSRSRGALWIKGETSGHTQDVVEVRVDCDQDAVLLKVRQTGGACHTGRPSCFYRSVGEDGRVLNQPESGYMKPN